MTQPSSISAIILLALAVTSMTAWSQTGSQSFEKKNFNYAEWTKGRFSEVVTIANPGRIIFLAGVGAEDEGGQPGTIRHKDDFMGQCRYSYDKIKRLLERHGATLGDIAKMITYVTDIRFQPDYGRCRREAFGEHPLPAHTFLNINQLAWPGMMVEIDATAVVK